MSWSGRTLFVACVMVFAGCGSDVVKKKPPMSSTGLGGVGGAGGGGTGGVIGGMVSPDAAVGAEPPRDGAVDLARDTTAPSPDVAVVATDTAVLTPDAAVVLPDAPLVVPDAPVVVPDMAAVVPDTATVTPDTAASPDTATPDAPVSPDTAPPDTAMPDMAGPDLAPDVLAMVDVQPDVAPTPDTSPDTTPDADVSPFCTPSGPRPALKKTLIADGLANPIEIVAPPDEPNTLWVLEHRSGKVRVINNGNLSPTSLTQVTVTASGGGRSSKEEGLFSIALAPDYATSKLFYLFYSAANTNTTVDEFVKNGPTATFVRNVYSRPSSHWFHNGGSIAFHPVTKQLHISVGDNQQSSEAQDQEGDLGRILRINLDTKAGTTVHFGLRNPWRFSFDALNGDLYVGDVGASGNNSENVFYSSVNAAKTNFGWGGNGGRPPALDQANFDRPIIGGIVYRGKKMPGLCGFYVYGTHQGGFIKTLKAVNGLPTQVASSGIGVSLLSSFGTDASGELYFSELGDGEVFRIDPQ